MKLKLLVALTLVTLTLGSIGASQATITADEKSEKICSLLNDTMVLSEKCKVDKANKTLSFTTDLEQRRAIMLCMSVKRIAYSNGWNLPTDWTIKVAIKQPEKMSKIECSYKATDLFG
ncbi:MAG: hypothetical protein OCD03_07880 [Hyphomicrobiales bacterium]